MTDTRGGHAAFRHHLIASVQFHQLAKVVWTKLEWPRQSATAPVGDPGFLCKRQSTCSNVIMDVWLFSNAIGRGVTRSPRTAPEPSPLGATSTSLRSSAKVELSHLNLSPARQPGA